jgi:hypothetical protein
MTKLMQQTFEQILQLSEDQQDTLAIYLQKNIDEILQKAEQEKQITDVIYTLDDLNEETQQAIKNIEQRQNLTICDNKNDLYNQLGI